MKKILTGLDANIEVWIILKYSHPLVDGIHILTLARILSVFIVNNRISTQSEIASPSI